MGRLILFIGHVMENWKSVVKLHKAHEKADTAFHASQNWWSTKRGRDQTDL